MSGEDSKQTKDNYREIQMRTQQQELFEMEMTNARHKILLSLALEEQRIQRERAELLREVEERKRKEVLLV